MKQVALFRQLDTERLRRAREISNVLSFFQLSLSEADRLTASQATVVLTYAAWEGFYNECAQSFIDYCSSNTILVRDISPDLLASAFAPHFESLRGRDHSREAQIEFVRNVDAALSCSAANIHTSFVLARSNLNFYNLRENFGCLGMSVARFERHRNRIDKELVGWRHAVAHGDSPDLSGLDARKHIEFVSEIMLDLSDAFQERVADISAEQ